MPFRKSVGHYRSRPTALLRASLGYIYAASGDEKKAREILDHFTREPDGRYISPYGIAEICVALREKERALRLLEKAAEEHSWWLVFADVNHRFDELRDEPRFQKIVRKLNLAE